MEVRRKRLLHGLKRKMEAIDLINRGVTQSEVAKKFDVSFSTVSNWKKNQFEIRRFCSLIHSNQGAIIDRKYTVRKPNQNSLDGALYTWYEEAAESGQRVTSEMVRQKAKELKGDHFELCRGWLWRWKRRHGINANFIKKHDERELLKLPAVTDEEDPLKLVKELTVRETVPFFRAAQKNKIVIVPKTSHSSFEKEITLVHNQSNTAKDVSESARGDKAVPVIETTASLTTEMEVCCDGKPERPVISGERKHNLSVDQSFSTKIRKLAMHTPHLEREKKDFPMIHFTVSLANDTTAIVDGTPEILKERVIKLTTNPNTSVHDAPPTICQKIVRQIPFLVKTKKKDLPVIDFTASLAKDVEVARDNTPKAVSDSSPAQISSKKAMTVQVEPPVVEILDSSDEEDNTMAEELQKKPTPTSSPVSDKGAVISEEKHVRPGSIPPVQPGSGNFTIMLKNGGSLKVTQLKTKPF